MMGRRRVGKTELLEQSFRTRNILKFEGIENSPTEQQQMFVVRKLAEYTQEPLITKLRINCWLDVFDIIYEHIKEGKWTLYFEEVQWLANYKDDFINQLKVTWDNKFRRNPQLILILCGSSPSFMIKHVIHSKSLYNRSQHDFHLKELNLQESMLLLGKKSYREIMNAYLTLGGIPEYLNRIKKYSSIFTGICEQSFKPNAYFTSEYQKIFVSSLAETPHYKNIIAFLSKRKFATRNEISKHLKLASGGRLSTFLEELILCGFIEKYTPYNLADNSSLARYCINDAYLQFFFKFIQPQLKAISQKRYQQQATQAIKTDDYQKWLGFAFERFCRKHSHQIASLLGFSAVKYDAGTFYSRATTNEASGYQIDLLFDRNDHVMTICEIKYTQNKTGTSVIDAFEKKLQRLPNKKNKTIHKVLISAEGADQALINRAYFDNILVLNDFFGPILRG